MQIGHQFRVRYHIYHGRVSNMQLLECCFFSWNHDFDTTNVMLYVEHM